MRAFLAIMTSCALGFVALISAAEPSPVPEFAKSIELKTKLLESAAGRAVAQQRKENFPDIPLLGTLTGVGGVKVEESADWDVNGDGKCYKITVSNIAGAQRDKGIQDLIQVRFQDPVDFLSRSTGMGMWVKADAALSEDLRLGVYFKGNEPDPIVFTDIPLRQKFGDNPHKMYIDWGFVFDNTCGVFKTPKNNFWKSVSGFDLVLAHRRLPEDGKKLEPASGTFYIDGLALEDIYNGSYDSDRFSPGKVNVSKDNLVAQGRTQQVARICAQFGGQEGRASAIRAMDMMVRLQCWDGSWPEMRTRLQGEFTHGMIVADLAYALQHLRAAWDPALHELIGIRHFKDIREKIYETMIYRGAMSRSPGPSSRWKDTYVDGASSMLSGVNRPMVLIFSQWVAAQNMTDPARKKALLEDYSVKMDDLVAHQGVTAGGWPIFGEGNAFADKGLHFDLGYTIDHVFIMSYASRVTNDKRWGDIMRKFNEVVKVMVLKDGVHFDGPWHERSGVKTGGQAKMKIPDLVYQEALRQGAPEFAQWGYNAHVDLWKKFPQDSWAYVGTARGYGLGAFLTWDCYDLELDPVPANPGLIFPRQWPIHTAVWHHKDGRKNVRKSPAIIQADGGIVNPIEWKLGEFPEITGLPLELKSSVSVEVEALFNRGSTRAFVVGSSLRVTQDGKEVPVDGLSFTCTVNAATVITVTTTGAECSFTVKPVTEGQSALMNVRTLAKP
ncbi:MAG: hypothetical protein AAB263_19225 [Planctomycetota bacterium]